MENSISVTSAVHEANRLRKIRQYVSDLPPGKDRDELYEQLSKDASALSARKLQES